MQIRALQPDFEVYAVDLRGHGQSSHAPPSPVPGEPTPVSDVLAVVHHLRLRLPLVLGHSLGGLLAVLAEARRPGTWGAMCLYEAVIPPEPMPVRKPPQIFR